MKYIQCVQSQMQLSPSSSSRNKFYLQGVNVQILLEEHPGRAGPDHCVTQGVTHKGIKPIYLKHFFSL